MLSYVLEMIILHIKRALNWTISLWSTLVLFWLKNPKETPSVFRFFWKKLIHFPRFLGRNVMTEKYGESFEQKLKNTQKLYQKYGKEFKPKEKASYKKLEKVFDDKSQILYFLIRKTKPKIVVETGVAAGASTGYVLKAIHDNGSGKLYSIDLPFQWYVYGKNHELHLDSLPPGKMPGYLVPEELKKSWKLILGDTYKELPKLLSKLGKIDIFLHDSEHTEKTMMFEYKEAWPRIKKGGILLSDDVNFTEAFDKFAKRNKTRATKFLNLGIITKK